MVADTLGAVLIIIFVSVYIMCLIWLFTTLNSINNSQKETVKTLRIIANLLSSNKKKLKIEKVLPSDVTEIEESQLEEDTLNESYSYIICPNCGEKTREDFEICIKCGNNI